MSAGSTWGKVNDGFPIVVCCNRVVGPWIQEEPDGCWIGKCSVCQRDFVFDDLHRIKINGDHTVPDA